MHSFLFYFLFCLFCLFEYLVHFVIVGGASQAAAAFFSVVDNKRGATLHVLYTVHTLLSWYVCFFSFFSRFNQTFLYLMLMVVCYSALLLIHCSTFTFLFFTTSLLLLLTFSSHNILMCF